MLSAMDAVGADRKIKYVQNETRKQSSSHTVRYEYVLVRARTVRVCLKKETVAVLASARNPETIEWQTVLKPAVLIFLKCDVFDLIRDTVRYEYDTDTQYVLM